LPILTEEERKARAAARTRAWYAANKDRHRETNKKYRQRPGVNRRQSLISKYGITPEEYDALFAAQGFACAVCLTTAPETKTKWHLDHNHSTGRVRGVLCHHCNLMLGNAKDTPSVLRAAAAYLEKTDEIAGAECVYPAGGEAGTTPPI
jgi:hypothetical protein